jgi:hypothetical protein
MPKITASREYHGNFNCLRFPKLGADIIAKATLLRKKLEATAEARVVLVREAAENVGLQNTGDLLLSLQSSNGYLSLPADLKAGVKEDLIELGKERAAIEQLRLIIENLPPDETSDLTFAELTYLGW